MFENATRKGVAVAAGNDRRDCFRGQRLARADAAILADCFTEAHKIAQRHVETHAGDFHAGRVDRKVRRALRADVGIDLLRIELRQRFMETR